LSFEDLMDFSNHNIYFLFGLARVKNNNDITKHSREFFREPIRSLESYKIKLDEMKVKCELTKHKMYMYVSVNARSTVKGYVNFKNTITEYESQALFGKEDFKDPLTRIDKLWYSCMMKPNARATKYFLLDIDTKDRDIIEDAIATVSDYTIKDVGTELKLVQETRNGYHVITTPFDVRILEGFEEIEVKKDGLLYLGCTGFEGDK
jgi:hypothetical protein